MRVQRLSQWRRFTVGGPRTLCLFTDQTKSLMAAYLLYRCIRVCSGVSRVWQAWLVPWAPLWRGREIAWQKLKSLFAVCWTSILRPIQP